MEGDKSKQMICYTVNCYQEESIELCGRYAGKKRRILLNQGQGRQLQVVPFGEDLASETEAAMQGSVRKVILQRNGERTRN